ncbi:hypothetical protein [Nesterenkonia alba]|uniref:hypothetical protein n=1 Tax=Nesterenkonia alba TaxID=515814 RepID=UPI0003B66A28|nr:hypothetical protein [Nesterenkonia alba]
MSATIIDNTGQQSLADAVNEMGSFAELVELDYQERSEYAGFGYLGERYRFLNETDPELLAQLSREDRFDIALEADMKVFSALSEAGYSREKAFEWMNSKLGRWFADAYFGSAGEDEKATVQLF